MRDYRDRRPRESIAGAFCLRLIYSTRRGVIPWGAEV
jgi:hypothetical protein